MGLGCCAKKANKKILLKPEFKNQTPKRIFKRLAEALEKYVRVLFTNTQKNAEISLMTQREELVAWELSFHRTEGNVGSRKWENSSSLNKAWSCSGMVCVAG
ncbi:hypothetical protein Pyn_16287 [Prunus yedoensis var. nudiflora]|uniref:Uncharacterized protein n=1 Tax=Prunus yedoensis var. nudiflora TaxID=2094558 RepID=A0A314UN43_PRUYE|nr:hypothetical protein Pyn_16287 [Prunus yedoensis var. nudiflora]